MRFYFTVFQFLFAYAVVGQSVSLVPLNKINPELKTDHWNAQWITHPNASVLEYGVFHFRKNFELTRYSVRIYHPCVCR